MSTVLGSPAAATLPGTVRRRRALAWFGAAVLAAPVTVILHELGHYAVGAAFGFPDLVLRYGSVGSSAAEQGFPLWQQGMKAAAGPLVTMLITALCCLYVARRGPHPLAVATGLVAPIRFLIGVVYLGYAAYIWMLGGRMDGANFDEYSVAQVTGIPLQILLVAELIFMAGAWWYLGRSIPRVERWTALLSAAAGMVLGLVLWLSVVGPRLLP